MKLFHHARRIVVLSGSHIHVLNTHGDVLHSTTTSLVEQDQQSGPIRCAAISHDARYLATTGDDKRLKIWDLDTLALSSVRILPKKPTSIAFSKNADVLVADKFGDVFRYTLCPSDATETQSSLASHDNPANGELVLGHASLLTDCLLSPDEKFILTADRDEHIRVSWYPEGHVIESYCLGHTKYVSAIHIPTASPAILISGGGDPELKVWDWMTGRLHRNITVWHAVEPFIRVRPKNRRHTSSREHDDDDDNNSNNNESKARSRGGRRRAGKAKQKDDVSMEPDSEHIACGPSGVATDETLTTTTAPVFVVRRLGSFISGCEHHIVFCAVGTTAIFEFVLDDTDAQPDIRHRDFGKPVIDFTLCEDNGTIWVLLDAADVQSEKEGPHSEGPSQWVHLVQWSHGQFVDARPSPVLDSLHSVCAIPATSADLEALDLYADLSTLPKGEPGPGASGGHASSWTQGRESISPANRNSGDSVPDAHPPADATTGGQAATSLTKRALGRLKHKRALDQLRQETRTTTTMTDDDGCDLSELAPDTKKMKTDSEDEDE